MKRRRSRTWEIPELAESNEEDTKTRAREERRERGEGSEDRKGVEGNMEEMLKKPEDARTEAACCNEPLLEDSAKTMFCPMPWRAYVRQVSLLQSLLHAVFQLRYPTQVLGQKGM